VDSLTFAELTWICNLASSLESCRIDTIHTNGVLVTLNERKWVEKFAKWPSVVLFLLSFGGVILLFIVWTELLGTIDNSVKGYFCAGLLICIGIMVITFRNIIGSFIYEANRRELTWLWKKVFRYMDEVTIKAFSRPPYECGFTILITTIVGTGPILTSIMRIVLSHYRM
jgi:hypothetical protein